MNTIIYFIRHVEPNYNNHDDMSRELTTKGLEASQKLITQFSSVSIDHFYSSPYQRAIDTITPLAKDRNLPIQIIDELRERQLSNGWVNDFNAIEQQQWQDFNFKLAHGESLREVQKRNIDALKMILKEGQGNTIVVGTHGTALSTIINYYQSDFGFDAFNQYKHCFPWIVTFEFDGNKLKQIML
ncbi:histidine phosphatase family protein [Staphylococcus coagulans]|uniref:histidine phosphatase family protein n=1 Tax=Staphylococcus coagulans TaxID=74706 RepID=UPI001F4BD246|nr:histidine phosphatase family protein [Staphylococcus coagulans]UNB46921.1 histidine phosphatase family protein [Staphylococcus coagulans]